MFFFTLLFVSLFSFSLHGSEEPWHYTDSPKVVDDQEFEKFLYNRWELFNNGQNDKGWASWTWETLQHPVVGAVASVIVSKGMQAIIERVFVDPEQEQQKKEIQKQQLDVGKQQIVANELIFRNAEREELERCRECILHGFNSKEKEAYNQQYFILLELQKQRLAKQLGA